MKSLAHPDHPASKRATGLKSPKSILVAQYSLLVSIGTGVASVTYFIISGPDDVVNIVGNVVNVATVKRSKPISYDKIGKANVS